MLLQRLEQQRARLNKPTRVGLARPLVQPEQRPTQTAPAKSVKPELDPKFLPQMVAYSTSEKPGTIIIETSQRFLYLVEGNGMAKRYGVGVGKAGI